MCWARSRCHSVPNKVVRASSIEQERNRNDGLRIRWHCWPPHTRRRYLGDYKYLPKLRFQREEADLDTRSGATPIAGLDPLVCPRTTRSQGVTQIGTENAE